MGGHAAMLSRREITLLFRHCAEHAVAFCSRCAVDFAPFELGRDFFLPGAPFVCPRCRQDLTRAVRGHVDSCEWMPGAIRKPPAKIERRDDPGSALGDLGVAPS